MKHKAASMLWESAPSDANAKSLEQACSVQSIVFTPCEDPGLAGQDFIKLMEINLENLRQALAKP